MIKKVDGIIKTCNENIGGDIHVYYIPENTYEYLVKNEGETIEIDKYRLLVGHIIYFSTNHVLRLVVSD